MVMGKWKAGYVADYPAKGPAKKAWRGQADPVQQRSWVSYAAL